LASILHQKDASSITSTLPVKYFYKIINVNVIGPGKTCVNNQKGIQNLIENFEGRGYALISDDTTDLKE